MTRTERSTLTKTLSGKTVVITGASRGIGLQISLLFAEQGANLIGIARSRSELDHWAISMSEIGAEASGITFDLDNLGRLGELVSEIKQSAQAQSSSGQIDILINNAGVETYRAFQEYRPEEIDTVICVNLLAPMQLTRRLLPLMPEGHIVNMASLAAKKGHPYDSAYAASKAGLLMWSHSLRQEMAADATAAKTRVSVVCPGYVTDVGMLADTGIKAPLLAGRSPAQTVAKAVLKAVLHNRAEIIVNQNWPLEIATRVQLAAEQLFPRLGDLSNRLLGITELNRQRSKPAEEPELAVNKTLAPY